MQFHREMQTPDPNLSDARLLWLVKTKLHGGRSLADNVRRLRWRRRRGVVPDMRIEETETEQK